MTFSLPKFFAVSVIASSVLSLTACAQNDDQQTSSLSNKEKAVAVISSIETGDQTAVGYINPDKYIQHNLDVADGLAGFGAVLQAIPEGTAKARVKRKRSF